MNCVYRRWNWKEDFDHGSSHSKGGVHVPPGGSFNGRGTIAISVQKVCSLFCLINPALGKNNTDQLT